jgi:hypothetical protein
MWTASVLAGRFDEALQLLATPDADDDHVVSYRQTGWEKARRPTAQLKEQVEADSLALRAFSEAGQRSPGAIRAFSCGRAYRATAPKSAVGTSTRNGNPRSEPMVSLGMQSGPAGNLVV